MRLPFGKVKDGENGELDQPVLVAPSPAYADTAHAHSSRSLPTDLKPPVSPLTEDKRSNSLFSRKHNQPPPSSLCPPPEPDDGSFKVVSFRHIGLPTHPAHAPNGSFVALAPRPRASRTFSSDSSQLISVAAFRDTQSRRNSMAGSLGSSFRAPSPGPYGPLPRPASVPGIRALQTNNVVSDALSDTEDDDYGDDDNDHNAESSRHTLKSSSSLPWATPANEKGVNQSETVLARPEADMSTVAARSSPVRKQSSLLSYSQSTEEGSLPSHLVSPWESAPAAAQKPSANIGSFVSLSAPSATPTVAHTSSDAGVTPLSPVITSTSSPQPPQLPPASVEDTDQDAFDMSWTLLNRLNESDASAPKSESSTNQSPEEIPSTRPRNLQAADPANRSSMAVLSTQPKAATHRRSASEQRSATQDDEDLAGVLGGALSLISRDANDPSVADKDLNSSFKPVRITRREPTPGFAVTSRPKQILANDAPKVAPSLDTWSVSSGSSEASSSSESLAPPPPKPATTSRASSPFKAGRPPNSGSNQSLAGLQARPPPQSAPVSRPRSSSQMPPPRWPRPWATPDSSTGDSSSPPTPKDGSDISSGPRRPFANETKPRSASLGVADEKAKEQAKIKTQMERHRKEARAAIELGHAVNPNSASDPAANKRQHQRRNSNMSAFNGWGGPMASPMAPSPLMMPNGQMVASPYMPLSPNPQYMAAAAAAAHQQQAMMYATQAYQLAAMQQQQAWAASSPVAWGTPQTTGYFPPQPVAPPRGSARPRTVSTPMKPKMTGQQTRAVSQPPKSGHGASTGPTRKRMGQPSNLR
ncbi:hypothetical protein CYLTODRAFT_487784 [Cylindrobasidium torrendii FP15055 ss-10]|uniref:Uncharacterized protein n=1 Tax=Cylindrobasidium torrendii FP15055 ss-10 TaxID=1314674 RepID=A0A0D7BJX5_9AGAR|nr:hypothetical protein CYLTODRAFT_487784 [Cylindrobasidium torrendii FP15055 ss-10]